MNEAMQENDVPAVKVDVQPEATETLGNVVIPLYRPATIKGKVVTEICLDFDGLTSDDLLNIEDQMLIKGAVAMKNAAFSVRYCLFIAARAAGVNFAEFKKMSLKDADAIVQATQGFMMRSASKTPEQSDD